MRKFVSSLIFSLMMTILSFVVIFLLHAPLMSFVYYGILSDENPNVFSNNILDKISNTDAMSIVLMLCTTILILGFVVALFIFIRKVIYVFLKEEKIVRPYYLTFFFLTTVVPVVLILLSIFLKVKLTILVLLFAGVFIILNSVLIIFSKEIFPDTTDEEHRRYLYVNEDKKKEEV